MNHETINQESGQKYLTESERYRLAKWVGTNGGLLIPSIHFAIGEGDFGWFILPGITAVITTPTVYKLFKKINKRDLLRIMGIWAKAVVVIAPVALAFMFMARESVQDPSLLRDFSLIQAAEFSISLTSMVLLIDFWIESQMKMNEHREKGKLTDESNGSPITKWLETMANKIFRFKAK